MNLEATKTIPLTLQCPIKVRMYLIHRITKQLKSGYYKICQQLEGRLMIFQSTRDTIPQKWELPRNFMPLNHDQDNERSQFKSAQINNMGESYYY